MSGSAVGQSEQTDQTDGNAARPPAALAALPTSTSAAPNEGSEQAARTEQRINLEVAGAAVRTVLQSLADFAKINLVLPSDIGGKVTLKLRDVQWRQALEAVVRSQGLGMEFRGNVLYVDRLDRLAAYDAAVVRRQRASQAAAPLVTRVIRLSYARAQDLAPIVRALLSPRGKVVVEPRTNSLIVTDVDTRVARVVKKVGGTPQP